MGRRVKRVTSTTPVFKVELGERQTGDFEEARPANTVDPLAHAFPGLAACFVCGKDLENDFRGFRPTRGVVRDACRNQLVEGRLGTSGGVFATNPDGDLGVYRVVD